MLEGDEGTHIAQALGPHKAAILDNHGLITVGQTIEAAVFWYINLEDVAQSALASLAAVGGDLKKLSIVKPEHAAV